jgi:hypothetical protein
VIKGVRDIAEWLIAIEHVFNKNDEEDTILEEYISDTHERARLKSENEILKKRVEELSLKLKGEV